MKRVLWIIIWLLLVGRASAQIVTPGGGGSVANGTVIGGTCPANQFVSAIGNPTGVPTCAVPPSGTGYPAGTTPQMTGYASANNSEAETLGGDATLARPSAGNYTITVTKTNGTAFTGLATATIPLLVVNGGTGTANPPTTGQMLIANSGTTYAPVTMGGDCTITSAGAVTCTKTSGVAFTGLATASIPLSVANGGHGSGTAPTSAQIPIAQSATAYTPQTLSGDATITNAGVITVTKTGGVAFTGLATASTPLSIANGGRGSSTAPTAGQIDIAQSATVISPTTMSGDCTITSAGAITCLATSGTLFTTFAPKASPTFTGTMTFPDGSTYTTAGHNTMKALGIGQAAGTSGGNPALLSVYANAAGTEPLIGVWNENTTDTSGQVGLALYTGTGGTIYPTNLYAFGPAYSANAAFPANSAALLTGEPNGLKIGSFLANSTVKFDFGGTDLLAVFLASAGVAGGMNLIQNVNANLNFQVANANTGTGAQAILQLSNATHQMWIAHTGTGATIHTFTPADTGYVWDDTQLELVTASNNPIQFWPNQSHIMDVSSDGVHDFTNKGLWTPQLEFGGVVAAGQSTTGVYYKMGHMVWVYYGLFGSATLGSGNATLCGFPFSPSSTGAGVNQGPWLVQGYSSFNVTTAVPVMILQQGNTCAQFYYIGTTNGQMGQMTAANFNAGLNYQGSFVYVTDTP